MKNFFKHQIRSKSPGEIIGIIIFGTIIITGLAALLGYVVMSLWNWLMPELFDLPKLSYWQAVGIFILAKLLLGGCGSKGKCKTSECKDKSDKNKTDFSKWKHYEEFWKEEGDEQYQKYIERQSEKDNTSQE